MQTDSYYDTAAPKRAINLSVNSDLLLKSKENHVNISKTLEESLEKKLLELLQQKWLEENKEAITQYNHRIEKKGAFSDGLRQF